MDDNKTQDNSIKPLPQDGDTPFSPPASPQDETAEGNLQREIEITEIDDTHPSTDSNVQPEETYDEGLSGATETSVPNAGDGVVDYDPKEDGTKE